MQKHSQLRFWAVGPLIPVILRQTEGVTFPVVNTEACVGHMAVGMEEDGHDIPRRGELWRRDVATISPKEVALILSYAVVDLYIVVGTVSMVLQLKVVKGQEDGGAFWHNNKPGAVDVVGIQAWEVWTGDVAGWCREDSSTFHTFLMEIKSTFSSREK